MAKLPRDIPCPHCGATRDWPCHTPTGYRAATHSARWNAVGIASPTTKQRGEAYEDGIRRDLELNRRAANILEGTTSHEGK